MTSSQRHLSCKCNSIVSETINVREETGSDSTLLDIVAKVYLTTPDIQHQQCIYYISGPGGWEDEGRVGTYPPGLS